MDDVIVEGETMECGCRIIKGRFQATALPCGEHTNQMIVVMLPRAVWERANAARLHVIQESVDGTAKR